VLPDLSFLLALVLGLFSLEEPSDAGPSAAFAAGGTAAVVLVVGALARMAADRAVRAADETDPAGVLVASRRMVFLPILGWAVALTVFRWGAFVASAVPASWFFVPYVALYLPLFVLFGSAWVSARQVEARLSTNAPSAWGAIGRGLRRNLIVLAPLGILLALIDLVRLLAAIGVPGVETAMRWHAAYPDLAAAAMVVMLFVLGLLGPWIFRRALRATPIPPGDLRRDLEGLAKVVGLKVRDFLLWDTRGRVANAMVVGITPGTRYVFLTDGLVSALTPPEVTAVVAHEAGHAKERHLPLYFVVGISLLLLSKALEDLAGPWLDQAGQVWMTLLFLFVFWFVVLGWLSRRFEKEADAFGADYGGALEPGAPPVETAGVAQPVPYGAALMMAVLRRLERMTGPVRHHRHAPPAERVAFLAAYATDPAVRESFRRERRTTRLAVFGFLLLALGVTAWRVPEGLERGRVRMQRIEGERWTTTASERRARGDASVALESFLLSMGCFS
jgi:STE24 endopeptidase